MITDDDQFEENENKEKVIVIIKISECGLTKIQITHR